mmetsp:Transcript_6808/g.10299  ORF Transcript_6808/g.10299 Transcript_6808/m.10299 type:complete len:373 (-) Transcript_6808:491-1609(-)
MNCRSPLSSRTPRTNTTTNRSSSRRDGASNCTDSTRTGHGTTAARGASSASSTQKRSRPPAPCPSRPQSRFSTNSSGSPRSACTRRFPNTSPLPSRTRASSSAHGCSSGTPTSARGTTSSLGASHSLSRCPKNSARTTIPTRALISPFHSRTMPAASTFGARSPPFRAKPTTGLDPMCSRCTMPMHRTRTSRSPMCRPTSWMLYPTLPITLQLQTQTIIPHRKHPSLPLRSPIMQQRHLTGKLSLIWHTQLLQHTMPHCSSSSSKPCGLTSQTRLPLPLKRLTPTITHMHITRTIMSPNNRQLHLPILLTLPLRLLHHMMPTMLPVPTLLRRISLLYLIPHILHIIITIITQLRQLIMQQLQLQRKLRHIIM